MPCAHGTIKADTSYKPCPVLTHHLGNSTARVLQQLHYWLSKENLSYGIIHDGRQWIRNSYNQWQQQIKETQIMSLITIRRAFSALECKGIVLSQQFEEHKHYKGGDQVKSYTINYDTLESLIGDFCKTLITRPRSIKDQQSGLNIHSQSRAGDSSKKANYHMSAHTTQQKRAPDDDQMSTPPDQMSTPLINRYISNKHSNKRSFSKSPQLITTTQPDKLEEKNKINIFEEMIQFWNNMIEETPNKVTLTPQRSQLLSIAFQHVFKSDLEQWIVFCRKIASSKFLMGEKANYTWKINFDWLFKSPHMEFPNIQRILEGNYSFGDRFVPDVFQSMNKQQNGDTVVSKKNKTSSCYESPEIDLLRKKLKQTLKEQQYDGHLEYLRWFANAKIHIEDKGDKRQVVLFVKDQYTYDVIMSRFDDIQTTFFDDIHIGLPETSSLGQTCLQENTETNSIPNDMSETENVNSSQKKSFIQIHDHVIHEEDNEQMLRITEDHSKTCEKKTGDVHIMPSPIAPVHSYSCALSDLKGVQIRKKIKQLIPDEVYVKWFQHAQIVMEEGRVVLHVPAYSIKQQLEALFADILGTFFDAVYVVGDTSQNGAVDTEPEKQIRSECVIEPLTMTSGLISDARALKGTPTQNKVFGEGDKKQKDVPHDNPLGPPDTSCVLKKTTREDVNLRNIRHDQSKAIGSFKETLCDKNVNVSTVHGISDIYTVNARRIGNGINHFGFLFLPIVFFDSRPPPIKKDVTQTKTLLTQYLVFWAYNAWRVIAIFLRYLTYLIEKMLFFHIECEARAMNTGVVLWIRNGVLPQLSTGISTHGTLRCLELIINR